MSDLNGPNPDPNEGIEGQPQGWEPVIAAFCLVLIIIGAALVLSRA